MNTATATPSNRLNRAYVQGKVIEANLEHLRVVLSDMNGDLRDELRPLAEGFEKYVKVLNQACTDADASATKAEPAEVVPQST